MRTLGTKVDRETYSAVLQRCEAQSLRPAQYLRRLVETDLTAAGAPVDVGRRLNDLTTYLVQVAAIVTAFGRGADEKRVRAALAEAGRELDRLGVSVADEDAGVAS